VKITETIERDCCLSKDLKPYNGKMNPSVKKYHPYFCIYCGQIWIGDTEMGPAGSNEPVTKPINITTDCWE